MAKILVVEGNTPEVDAATRAVGDGPAAEVYASVLDRLAPGHAYEIIRPSFPEFDIGRLCFETVDGVVFTGSGVQWSAVDREAATHRAVMEAALGSGLPVIGSCYGLQLGAAVLGARIRANPKGSELGVARRIRVTEAGAGHQIHAGRAPVFDCVCIHRDEVEEAPTGAVVTATNGHSTVQAMVYERDGVRFWGMQYHPELEYDFVVRIIERGRRQGPFAEGVVPDEPPAPEVLDFRRRTVELANWLARLAAEPDGAEAARA